MSVNFSDLNHLNLREIAGVKTMAERWTDERLDRFADKVDSLSNDIQQLIQALYLELPTVKAEINSVREEAKEQRETLHAELVEIKEITKQQAITSQIQIESLHTELIEIKEITRQQAIIAQTQAESIRLMIEMLNRKQA